MVGQVTSAPFQASANADAASDLACFGWSARAWAEPWRAFRRAHPDLHVGDALELGAGEHSSLAPLLLPLADRVECSAYDAAALPAIEARHRACLPSAEAARMRWSQRDLRALVGRWDLIVMKSVLGGVHRTHNSRLADVHATLERLRTQHLRPGGWLLTLDNGRTALEPLWSRFGARRNGWRFFAAEDFPPAAEHRSFGVLSSFSAATRLGALGQRIDDALYAADLALTPLARQHAVHLHVYRAPA